MKISNVLKIKYLDLFLVRISHKEIIYLEELK